VKKGVLADTKNDLDDKIKLRELWGGLKTIYSLIPMSTTELSLCPETINDYFVNISLPSSSDHLCDFPTKPVNLNVPDGLCFSFSSISASDIKTAWKKTKNRTSTSYDTMGICRRMLNFCLDCPLFLHYLTDLFNVMIFTFDIPACLKLSRVIAIPKKPNPDSPNDLRPVSIQPALCKLFEKCIVPQITNHFEHHNLLSKNQFGLHSTAHAVVALTDFLYNEIDAGKICILVAIDLRKAFDKVDRNVRGLIQKKLVLLYDMSKFSGLS
jgi:hypothetical protein